MGFLQNPFTKFSAEEELQYLSDIYVKPKYFDSLYSNLTNGSSRFIIGSRGSGKTALLMQLKTKFDNDNIITLLFDNFENIPIKDNEKYFLFEIISELITEITLIVSKNPHLIKKLDEFDKEKLAYFVQEFFKTLSKREYLSRNNKVERFKVKNWFIDLYNNFFHKPVNLLISGAIEVTSDLVTKSLGLNKNSNVDFYKNYLPELQKKVPTQTTSTKDYDYNSLKNILNDISKILKKLGYKNLVILIDKIDENRNLKGSINEVCLFIQNLLKDTNLLMQNDFSLVFSIWDEVRKELASNGVRFDKFKPVDVTWTDSEILEILDNRIKFFCTYPKKFEDFLVDTTLMSDLINLSNNSPRDLLHLVSKIYDEQSIIDSNTPFFSKKSIEEAKLKFCKEYEYYALFPTERKAKDDIIKNINRLLKNGKIEVKSVDLAAMLKVSSSAANNYIRIMLDFNLIKNTPQQYVYQIADPKLKFLIDQGIKEI